MITVRSKHRVRLAPQDRQLLEARVQSRSGRADEAREARIVPILADGETYDEIQGGRRLRPRIHQSLAEPLP
jgi:hypothetical protein